MVSPIRTSPNVLIWATTYPTSEWCISFTLTGKGVLRPSSVTVKLRPVPIMRILSPTLREPSNSRCHHHAAVVVVDRIKDEAAGVLHFLHPRIRESVANGIEEFGNTDTTFGRDQNAVFRRQPKHILDLHGHSIWVGSRKVNLLMTGMSSRSCSTAR